MALNFVNPHKNFNPLPPRGGRQACRVTVTLRHGFQSTPSTRRETVKRSRNGRPRFHFNPLPPRGGRHGRLRHGDARRNFNPLPPRGGRPPSCSAGPCTGYFNPLPPRGGRLVASMTIEDMILISIHSLHAEGDIYWLLRRSRTADFNPLPPRGGRPSLTIKSPAQRAFQSTPSTRRETDFPEYLPDKEEFQSTPSTRRETVSNVWRICAIIFQSTPSTRRETRDMDAAKIAPKFQSTPSTRRETLEVEPSGNIRQFQSTPSTRRETFSFFRPLISTIISIHSLHAEGDFQLPDSPFPPPDFNPLPPRGGRRTFWREME